jgi:hypothetical protein
LAAITPTAPAADVVYGQQFRQGNQILFLNFVLSGGASDTWQAPTSINPTNVAWSGVTSTDIVAVTMDAATKVVTFTSDGLAAYEGNLLLVVGGKS